MRAILLFSFFATAFFAKNAVAKNIVADAAIEVALTRMSGFVYTKKVEPDGNTTYGVSSWGCLTDINPVLKKACYKYISQKPSRTIPAGYIKELGESLVEKYDATSVEEAFRLESDHIMSLINAALLRNSDAFITYDEGAYLVTTK